jgi:tRNA threonylcarbamoyladenosine biosynthesis protein TsaE
MNLFAEKLSKKFGKGDILALKGNLGVGKTTFSKAFINSILETKENVTSPTFNLIQTYSAKNFDIWHIDLYRLKNIDELFHLGIEDAFNESLILIEWPEIAFDILPKKTVLIEITNLEPFNEDNKNKRQITIRNLYE